MVIPFVIGLRTSQIFSCWASALVAEAASCPSVCMCPSTVSSLPSKQVWPWDKVLSSSTWAQVTRTISRLGLKSFYMCSCRLCLLLGWLGCPHLGDTGDIPKDCKAAVSLVRKQLGGRAIPKTWTPAQYYLVSKNKTKKCFYWLKPWNYGIWGASLYHSLA